MLKVMYYNLLDMITKLIIAIESNTTGVLGMESYAVVQNLVAILVNMVIAGVIANVIMNIWERYNYHVNRKEN